MRSMQFSNVPLLFLCCDATHHQCNLYMELKDRASFQSTLFKSLRVYSSASFVKTDPLKVVHNSSTLVYYRTPRKCCQPRQESYGQCNTEDGTGLLVNTLSCYQYITSLKCRILIGQRPPTRASFLPSPKVCDKGALISSGQYYRSIVTTYMYCSNRLFIQSCMNKSIPDTNHQIVLIPS